MQYSHNLGYFSRKETISELEYKIFCKQTPVSFEKMQSDKSWIMHNKNRENVFRKSTGSIWFHVVCKDAVINFHNELQFIKGTFLSSLVYSPLTSSSASASTLSALVWARQPYFPACFRRMLLIIRSAVEDCWMEEKIESKGKQRSEIKREIDLHAVLDTWAMGCCYSLYWLVWIKRFLFGLRARAPLLFSICSSLEMRNAPGETANNSRSTGSSLVQGLIKITAHESDSWVLHHCLPCTISKNMCCLWGIFWIKWFYLAYRKQNYSTWWVVLH